MYFFVIFFLFLSLKLLRLLLKVNKVTTEHQKWRKISKISIQSSFFAQRTKKSHSKAKALRRS